MKTVGISYGVMSNKINEQLDSQGFNYDLEKINSFEREREAINILRFGSLLTDSMIDKILPKLHKKIVSHVAKKNGMSEVKK